MNLGVKPQTQEGVVECFFVSDVTTQKWGGLGIGGWRRQWRRMPPGGLSYIEAWLVDTYTGAGGHQYIKLNAFLKALFALLTIIGIDIYT